jgi:heme-degrading monooxygenase HmoA
MEKFCSAGDWTIKPGQDEQAFIRAWRDSLDVDPPIHGLFSRARLLRDVDRPGHLLSIVEWESREAITEFRSRPSFPEETAPLYEYADVTLLMLEQVAEKVAEG